MDRPVSPNMFGSPVPDPERIDPPGGFAHMPPSAPDPRLLGAQQHNPQG